MELVKIKGNTYYIPSNTNIGVYVYKNKFCLLIDSGINNTIARKIDEVLKDNNLHPKYIINTHSHIDHCGGNHYFKENYSGTLVYTSEEERVYMENPILHSLISNSGTTPKRLFKTKKPFEVDYTLEYGINKINDEKFEILSLSGHSHEHIGIITPEKVCFLGDSIFSNETLDKYPFPYLFNIEETLKTLNTLRDVDSDYFVISHGKDILNKDELNILIERNIKNIEDTSNTILELLDQPCTKEDILENIIILNDISVDVKEYLLDLCSLSGFLSYLYDLDLIDCSIEDGKLYYFRKQ
ncbi:MBL fold metallo-hydrolase [Clostridium ganghwense]|uniref:MBL fold metallo-hydrolase n=1 Tax=Clostridium ganghwense TaxID=312089 RepID=A0ABT4CUQ4_9CLOT|nr:MBL fold metallo-hydrolase [Clostridium ganghwense]MCY6371776.1 MBL fold metallo-hydrolase [Clostridium ganghwense]